MLEKKRRWILMPFQEQQQHRVKVSTQQQEKKLTGRYKLAFCPDLFIPEVLLECAAHFGLILLENTLPEVCLLVNPQSNQTDNKD